MTDREKEYQRQYYEKNKERLNKLRTENYRKKKEKEEEAQDLADFKAILMDLDNQMLKIKHVLETINPDDPDQKEFFDQTVLWAKLAYMLKEKYFLTEDQRQKLRAEHIKNGIDPNFIYNLDPKANSRLRPVSPPVEST